MDEISDHALDTLAAAGLRAAGEHGLAEALQAVADAVVEVTEADAAAVRVVDASGRLPVRTVASHSQALAAELAGSTFSLEELPAEEASSDELPAAVQRAARRAHSADVLLIAIRADDVPLGSLELLRAGRGFDPSERAAARLAAAQLGLVLRAFDAANGMAGSDSTERLALAGDALGAGLDETRGPDEVVRIAARASGAEAAQLWEVDDEGGLERLASTGRLETLDARSSRAADRARAGPRRGGQGPNGRHAHAGPASARRPSARVRARKLALAARHRPAGHLRRSRGAGAACRRARAGDVARARTIRRAAHGSRSGGRRALPGAHAGDRRRGRLQAAASGPCRDLPRRREPAATGGRLRRRCRACRRRTPPRARVRAAARPGRAPRSGRAGRRPARSRSCGRGRSADRRCARRPTRRR